MCAKSVVAPIDRVKILFQCTDAEFRLSRVPSVARSIVRVEGVSALWRGNTATLLRVFPYAGAQFAAFDHAKQRLLSSRRPDDDDDDDHDLTPSENVAAGACAGALSVACTYPLDLARARLAVESSSSSSAHDVDGRRRGSLRSVLSSNFRERGVAGLYRGITPTMLGILPYSSIAFTINEQSKNKIRRRSRREPTTTEKMVCGGVAGLVAQSLTYPLEIVRRRMQTHGHVSNVASRHLSSSSSSSSSNRRGTGSSSSTMSGIVRRLYAEEGAAGFFKGLSMNWMKGPIAFSISFTTYDVLKAWMAKTLDDDHHHESGSPT